MLCQYTGLLKDEQVPEEKITYVRGLLRNLRHLCVACELVTKDQSYAVSGIL